MLAADSEVQRILRCHTSDHHSILGLSLTATHTPLTLRRQYLKLAVKVHPDKHEAALQGQANQAFMLLSQAYEAKLNSLNSGVRATEFASQQNDAQVLACSSLHIHMLAHT